jgi:Heavy metal associated domain 2
MHLITAFLVTTLRGQKRSAGHVVLPSFVGVVETSHALPGRLRLRAPVLVGKRAAADQLKKSLGRIDGVCGVEVSPATGSLLFHFAPDRVKPAMLIGATIRLLGLENDVERPPPSYVGAGIRRAGESLNYAVHNQTAGMLDLWTSLTLLMAGMGIRQLAKGDRFGWPLLWWAYRSMFPPEGSRQ